MVKINYDMLEIEHIVNFNLDSTIFAAARDGSHLRIFLIYESSGNVYTRNGRIDSWDQLFGSERDSIIARVISARNNRVIPTYSINSTQSVN